MTILTRYTLKQIWIPALMAAAVISFVMMLGAIGEKVQFLLEERPIVQITLFDISRLSVYSIPSMTGFIFPVTFLLGIMLTFGRMAQTSELTAAKAAGIPLRRLVLPIVGMGAAVSAACFLLLDQGQPWAFRKVNQLGSEMLLRVTLDAVPVGVMHEYGEWRVYIGQRDSDRTLHNVIVLQDKADGIQAFYARRARVYREGGVSRLEMEAVRLVEDDTRTTTVASTTLTLPELKAFALDDSERRGWALRRMLREEAVLENAYAETSNEHIRDNLEGLRMEIGERLAFPLMCLAVSIVAAPIGARARRSGRSYTFVSGVAIVAAYFILRTLLKDFPPPSLPAAIVIAQIPNAALIAAGVLLIWRVDRL